MEFNFNFYALLLIVSGTFSLLLSYFIYRKKGEAVRFFAIMICSSAIWSLGYGFELASNTLCQAKSFINVEYLGIASLPLNWFLFTLSLSGKDQWYKKKLNLYLLTVIPVITVILVWTNSYHHFFYADIRMEETNPFPTIAITPGIAYRIFTVYFYSLLALGSYWLIVKFRTADPIYKRQNYSILIAAVIPWATNMLYLSGFRPMRNLDLTPFSFTATMFLIAISIYRFKLFDILPVAREKVLDLVQDGFLVLDNRLRVIEYNRAFTKYLPNADYERRIVGTPIERLFPGQTALFKILRARETGKIELKLGTEKASYDIEADIVYLKENELNSEAVIIKLQDLTQMRAESFRSQVQAQELQKLNQLKDRVFSIIAHDLRAPLVNLSEILKMISNDLISLEEFKILSPSLSKDILYTTDLLENILHWSRSQLKGYGINKEFFDLKGLVVNEVEYHLPAAKAKKIEVIQDVFPGAMIYADMLMIQIVIRNIINNAIKFCHEGCMIQITAVYIGEKHIRVCIKDTGVGMDKEVLQKLFTADNQSNRGTMNEKGTGLGMMVCKEFVERNDGEIYAESEPGKGSKFCIHLPVDKPA